jgi:hypothetical membrane protein
VPILWPSTPNSLWWASCGADRGSPISEFGALADAEGGFPRPIRAAAGLWLAGATVYLVCEAIAAARFPGYRYTADYISDLGVSAVMNVGAFATHGVLFLAGAVVLTRACSTRGWASRAFLLAAVANAVGNIVVATFRSGAVDPSGHADWHVIGAGMAIVGGNVAVIIAGLGSRRLGASGSYRLVSVAIGALGLACLLALIIDGATGSRLLPAGLMERGGVYSIIGWEIITGLTILIGRGPKRGRCSRR